MANVVSLDDANAEQKYGLKLKAKPIIRLEWQLSEAKCCCLREGLGDVISHQRDIESRQTNILFVACTNSCT